MNAGAEDRQGWGVLLQREWLPALAVLLGGILLHSMNVLMLATVLPTIVGELGGAALMSLPSTAFLASSIIAHHLIVFARAASSGQQNASNYSLRLREASMPAE